MTLGGLISIKNNISSGSSSLQSRWIGGRAKRNHYKTNSTNNSYIYCHTITRKRSRFRSYRFVLNSLLAICLVLYILGLPENVEVAKQEIESHIAQRTGSASTLIDRDLDFAANGTDVLENGEEDTIM